MAETNLLTADIRLNLEGHWPRATYLQLCQQHGIEYTEDGYLHWRDVGERLTGELCFETTVRRAAAAVKSLGLSLQALGPHWSKLAEELSQREKERIKHGRRQPAGHEGAAGPDAQ